jgi:superfamily II DNA or RNA helicase
MNSVPESASTPTKSFPDCLHFQMAWRQYQARILDRLPEYLSDRRVHLVAAPGSGKTILGLEIIRRIGEPTLVLAPTITIRDQWVDRLATCFLVGRQPVPGWLSVDLKSPAVVTVTTYQALHALCGPANHHRDAAEEEEADTETTDTKWGEWQNRNPVAVSTGG